MTTEGLPLFEQQRRELKRVTSALGEAVMSFLRRRNGAHFHMAELNEHCAKTAPMHAPDSPRRVMRALCADGHADVELVSRRESLYRVRSAE